MNQKASGLRRRLQAGEFIRIAGAHHALGAKLIEKNAFDGVWASGLEISTAHGVPDANILTMTENLEAAQAMNDACSLPVICDCDTGYGNASNVIHMVKKYDAAGLAAVVIEDKRFPKVNSFVPGRQELASVQEFMGKLEAAANARREDGILVFARIEALIAGWGMEEALRRADAYAEAGADGIVIHSKATTPDEVYTFRKRWAGNLPLVVIPTTYFDVPFEDFAAHGFQMVIYANHGLRASIRAMDQTFARIHATGSTAAVEKDIVSLKEVFQLQGMVDMKQDEKKYLKRETVQAIIPAASDHRHQPEISDLVRDRPLCMVDIAGKSLISRQAELLRSSGVTDIAIVGGYLCERIEVTDAKIIPFPDYARHHSAHSIMAAEEFMKERCLIAYSDILFDANIVKELLASPHDITLVIDRAFQTLPSRDKKLDLVSAPSSEGEEKERSLTQHTYRPITQIGKKLPDDKANYEFIGLVFMREKGCEVLKAAWHKSLKEFQNKPFFEAPDVSKAGLTDLLQYLIREGYPVYGMEIDHGWSEIHSGTDYARVNAYFSQTESAT